MNNKLPAVNIPTRSSSIRKPQHNQPPSLPISPTSPISPKLSASARIKALTGLNSPDSPSSPPTHANSLSTASITSSTDSDVSLGPNAPLGNRMPVSEFSTIAHHLTINRTSLANTQTTSTLADTHIQNGIVLHEQLKLVESTKEFERAANLGSATGMYLFGMALRSGWGVKCDEKRSFEYLSRAADLALKYASNNSATRDASARELTLAIYELGQSFRNGWGVKKDRRVGAHYLQIAANLGDPDAQVDVATAFINGDGVKRDKVTAAKYFRLAANSGYRAPSMMWIWKPKYDCTGILQTRKAGF